MKAFIYIALFGLIAALAKAHQKPFECKEGESFANPKDCTTYFFCLKGYPILESCPTDFHYDPKWNICRRAKFVGCVETPALAPVTCPPQASIEDDVLLANPEDCGSFYQCAYGVPHLIHCPAGLHWNDRKKLCDYPKQAKCVIA